MRRRSTTAASDTGPDGRPSLVGLRPFTGAYGARAGRSAKSSGCCANTTVNAALSRVCSEVCPVARRLSRACECDEHSRSIPAPPARRGTPCKFSFSKPSAFCSLRSSQAPSSGRCCVGRQCAVSVASSKKPAGACVRPQKSARGKRPVRKPLLQRKPRRASGLPRRAALQPALWQPVPRPPVLPPWQRIALPMARQRLSLGRRQTRLPPLL